MKKSRLVLVCFLVLAMSLSFFAVACDGNNPSGSTAPDTTDATEATTTQGTTDITTETVTEAPTTSEGTTEPASSEQTTETDTEVEPSTTDAQPDSDIPEADSELSVEQAIALGESLAHNEYTEGKYYVTATVKAVVIKTTGNMTVVDSEGNTITVSPRSATLLRCTALSVSTTALPV